MSPAGVALRWPYVFHITLKSNHQLTCLHVLICLYGLVVDVARCFIVNVCMKVTLETIFLLCPAPLLPPLIMLHRFSTGFFFFFEGRCKIPDVIIMYTFMYNYFAPTRSEAYFFFLSLFLFFFLSFTNLFACLFYLLWL